MKNQYSIEKEFVNALCKFSYGKVTLHEAEEKARIYVPKLLEDKDCSQCK